MVCAADNTMFLTVNNICDLQARLFRWLIITHPHRRSCSCLSVRARGWLASLWLWLQSAGVLSADVPAALCFVPDATKLLVYTSPLLMGRVLLYDYRLASVVRSVGVPQVGQQHSARPHAPTHSCTPPSIHPR